MPIFLTGACKQVFGEGCSGGEVRHAGFSSELKGTAGSRAVTGSKRGGVVINRNRTGADRAPLKLELEPR